MNRFVAFLFLSTILPENGAWIVSPGHSRATTKLAATQKRPKHIVYVDPTASWASDLDQLEQLEKDLAEKQKKKKPKERVYVDPTASWASDLDQLEQLEKDLAEKQKKKPKHIVYVDPTALWASDLDQLERLEKDLTEKQKKKKPKERVYVDPTALWASDLDQLERLEKDLAESSNTNHNKEEHIRELRHRHYENRKYMTKDGDSESNEKYVYVDPTVAWASDVADLDALEVEEKEAQLRDLRLRHHEDRKVRE